MDSNFKRPSLNELCLGILLLVKGRNCRYQDGKSNYRSHDDVCASDSGSRMLVWYDQISIFISTDYMNIGGLGSKIWGAKYVVTSFFRVPTSVLLTVYAL